METSHLHWYYRQAIETLRYEGLQSVVWRMVVMCLSPFGFLRLVTFYQKDLTQPLKEIQAKVEITVGQANESDVDQLATLVARRYGPSKDLGPHKYKKLGIQGTILNRFRRGHRCFVGKIGSDIIHYNWIFFGWEELLGGVGRFIRLRNDEAFCDDAYTEEAWRGRAIHTVVQNQMLLFLQKAGYRRAYTIVGIDKKSALKTHHRLGWEPSGTMLCFTPRGAKKAWIWRIKGTLDPFVGESIPAI
ncbi:MAG: hypothetical protein GTO24_08565 [candidate division Zixibacteria bacterium]|nr:hypothetical protein [candidate division Zixibacteria bacterium]